VDERQSDSDRALVHASAQGDRKAQTALVLRVVPVVRAQLSAIAARLGGTASSEIADLVQDVLVELWRNELQELRRWDPARGLSLPSFVRLVARRLAMRRLDRRYKAEALAAATAPDVIEAFGERVPVAERDELDDLLRALYAELGPRDRELFERLFLEQQESAEVAAALGMSGDALKKWRSRFYARASAIAARLEGPKADAGTGVRG
jgi:RNA polymerase sigma-70 factor (ECF subfamily)